ncbi:MAG: alpha/beta fold hydrolase [Patescibacteria group bacterium]
MSNSPAINKVSFQNKGQRIDATLISPQTLTTRVPGVIFFHGLTSSEKNYLPLAVELASHGIISLTVNLRGHASSEGTLNTLTIDDGFSDGEKAYEFLVSQTGVDIDRIGVCGASLGGAIAADLCSHKGVKSVVLRAPAIYSTTLREWTYGQIMSREKEVFQDRVTNTDIPTWKILNNFRGCLLVIASEFDSIIPLSLSEKYVAEAPHVLKSKLVIIPGATHQLVENAWKEQFRTQTIQWFVETL